MTNERIIVSSGEFVSHTTGLQDKHQITGTFQTSMAVVACDQLMGHGFV